MNTSAFRGRPAPAVASRPTTRFPRWFLRAPELIFRLRLSFLAPTLLMLVTTGIYRLIGERIRGEEDIRRLARDNVPVWVARERK